MPTEESKLESFEESVSTIAEKVRGEKARENAAEQQEGNAIEQQREAELEKIRTELQESYGDIGGGGGSDDDGDDDDGDEEEFDSTATLQPANLEGTKVENYLEKVPEKYREPVTELVQGAVHNGIVGAVKKAQKKNDPYLIDIFHDSLAQLLHQKMHDQGLL
ncbi:MAG: hypothetical protein OXB96_02975 [Candidatus Kaiserbacteria bacterium]|nr:hypothetical protein [Candidatus Kaiserbacteria bacterium]